MATDDILERLRRFEIPGRLTLQEGNGELPKIEVTTEWSTAEIYLHGAHVTDFQKKDEPALLFLSQCARFAPGHPIRGGIPIVFPWFGAREDGPFHGFARTADWDLHETIALPDGGVSLRFSLPPTAESATLPAFTAYYVVTVTDTLALELIVTNTDPNQDFTFEACFHTYFAVGDIRAVALTGLKGLTYLDQLENHASHTDDADALTIAGETDRIYLDHSGAVDLLDRSLQRRIRIEKSGSASTVVWNPWLAKSQRLADFANDEYQRMLCVESGNVARNSLTLAPGRSAALRVQLATVPLR